MACGSYFEDNNINLLFDKQTERLSKNDRKKNNNRALIRVIQPSTKRDNKLFPTWIRGNRGVGVFLSILAIIGFCWQCEDKFKTPHQKRLSSGYVHGIQLPYSLKSSHLEFHAGSNLIEFPVEDFSEWNEPKGLIKLTKGTPFRVELKITGDKLFTKMVLKDRYDEKIGVLEGERYEFTVGEDKFDFDENDTFFEVVDRDRNVLFEMKFEEPNKYYMQGYVDFEFSIWIINNNGIFRFDKRHKDYEENVSQALKEIEHFNPRWKNGYNSY